MIELYYSDRTVLQLMNVSMLGSTKQCKPELHPLIDIFKSILYVRVTHAGGRIVATVSMTEE